MFRLPIVIASLLIPAIVNAQGLTVRELTTRVVRPLDHVHYYDEAFLFASRGYGNSRSAGGNTVPGFFVHSKADDRWFQILAVSTRDAKLGKSSSDNPADARRLRTLAVLWDYTPYANKPSIELPLKTSGSISFPEELTFEPSTQRFVLRFMTSWQMPSVATTLYIKRSELLDAMRRSPR